MRSEAAVGGVTHVVRVLELAVTANKFMAEVAEQVGSQVRVILDTTKSLKVHTSYR